MKMMNKETIDTIMCAATIIAAFTITFKFMAKVSKNREIAAKSRKDEQIKELVYSIEAVLDDISVVDFDLFAEHLEEYYNIEAELMEEGEVIYSSPKFDCPISSNDIYVSRLGYDDAGYNLKDLCSAFRTNKEIGRDDEIIKEKIRKRHGDKLQKGDCGI